MSLIGKQIREAGLRIMSLRGMFSDCILSGYINTHLEYIYMQGKIRGLNEVHKIICENNPNRKSISLIKDKRRDIEDSIINSELSMEDYKRLSGYTAALSEAEMIVREVMNITYDED